MQVKRPSTVSCARTKSRAGSSPQATGPARLPGLLPLFAKMLLV